VLDGEGNRSARESPGESPCTKGAGSVKERLKGGVVGKYVGKELWERSSLQEGGRENASIGGKSNEEEGGACFYKEAQ